MAPGLPVTLGAEVTDVAGAQTEQLDVIDKRGSYAKQPLALLLLAPLQGKTYPDGVAGGAEAGESGCCGEQS